MELKDATKINQKQNAATIGTIRKDGFFISGPKKVESKNPYGVFLKPEEEHRRIKRKVLILRSSHEKTEEERKILKEKKLQNRKAIKNAGGNRKRRLNTVKNTEELKRKLCGSAKAK